MAVAHLLKRIKSTVSEQNDPETPEKDGAYITDHNLDVTPGGVVKVAAATRVWTPKSMIFLFIGIAFVAYVYSLDNTTTYLYQAIATSSFNDHSGLSTVQTVSSMILAVGKPVAAKISDVIGRAEAYTMSIVLYLIGYIMIAASNNMGVFTGGMVFYSLGQASIQILQQIIIADVTTLRWRGLVTGAFSLPFFINAFVASNIGADVIAGAGWRWGYAMFCFIVPAATAPILIVLYWAQWKARRLGVVATSYYAAQEQVLAPKDTRSFGVRAFEVMRLMDLGGLFLLTAGLALFLIPMTLVGTATTSTLKWSSYQIIIMLVLGAVLLCIFVPYEMFVPVLPVLPFRFFRSPTVVASVIINFFDFVSFYLQYTFQYSFIYITHSGWSLKDQGYFAYTQTLALTFFAVFAGVYMVFFRRGKWLLVVGLVLRMVAVGAMIYTKGAHGSTGGLVMTQIVQGLGGGIGATVTQVLVQASMRHKDMAAATAVLLLFAEIGNCVGTAIAGAVWRSLMPGQLQKNLSGLLNQTEIDAIYSSITTAVAYPDGSPVHEGVVNAYNHVMRNLLIAATCTALPPIIASLFVKDIKLTDTQNSLETDDELIEEVNEVAGVKTRDEENAVGSEKVGVVSEKASSEVQATGDAKGEARL